MRSRNRRAIYAAAAALKLRLGFFSDTIARGAATDYASTPRTPTSRRTVPHLGDDWLHLGGFSLEIMNLVSAAGAWLIVARLLVRAAVLARNAATAT
jgi:hypothetical protein